MRIHRRSNGTPSHNTAKRTFCKRRRVQRTGRLRPKAANTTGRKASAVVIGALGTGKTLDASRSARSARKMMRHNRRHLPRQEALGTRRDPAGNTEKPAFRVEKEERAPNAIQTPGR
ncbi:hypothetical protein HPB50_003261 [Hyalomma asiaticum]|uniref:Uncharacterized protein n=1 Tax=Hyalomma asiaticum TaxID=266040 RepID=A0ACB7RMC7_HYAAI|nr:hypothetical protein HPB50_003261 [Hyalomma asiaticum]